MLFGRVTALSLTTLLVVQCTAGPTLLNDASVDAPAIDAPSADALSAEVPAEVYTPPSTLDAVASAQRGNGAGTEAGATNKSAWELAPSPPVLRATESELGTHISYAGLPALSGDGRTVVAVRNFEIVYLDASSGREIRAEEGPESVVNRAGEPVHRVDRRRLRWLNHHWRRDGYRALMELPQLSGGAAEAYHFSDGRFSIRGTTDANGYFDGGIRWSQNDGPTLHAIESVEGDGIAAAYLGPHASFLLLRMSYCACECGYWPVLLPR